MRNLLALVGAVVVGVGGAGWYLGWYKLDISKGIDGKHEIKTTVNTDKLTEDSGTAIKQVGAFIGEHIDKAKQDAKPATTPGPLTIPNSNTSLRGGDPDASVFWPVSSPMPAETRQPIRLVPPGRD